MIRQLNVIDEEKLSLLKSNHYTRRIKSHYQAYGTSYDFSRFFEIIYDGNFLGIISVFNSSMMISTVDGITLGNNEISEMAGFVLMNMPSVIELELCYSKRLYEMIESDYKIEDRTQFEYISKNKRYDLEVNELPKLDDVFGILRCSFEALASSYELWLTDTSHRRRRGLLRSFMYRNNTTATVQYIVDGTALIGHVATAPEVRGRYYARKLLYWIGEKMTSDGLSVKLFARSHRVSYYEEIGFKEISKDVVLERKNDK